MVASPSWYHSVGHRREEVLASENQTAVSETTAGPPLWVDVDLLIVQGLARQGSRLVPST